MKSIRIYLLLLVVLMYTQASQAQRKWDDKYYEKLTNDDFRDFKLFKKSIDLKDPDYKVLNAAIFFVTNEARIKKGVAPVGYNENLEIMAWNHSKDMGEDDFFDHENPKNKKRRTADLRAGLAGITNPFLSENISSYAGAVYGSYLELADRIVVGWINSPPHAKTLFSPTVIQLGCGAFYYRGKWQGNKDIKKQGDGFWISTQDFQSVAKVVSEKPKDKGPRQ